MRALNYNVTTTYLYLHTYNTTWIFQQEIHL